MPGCQNFKPEKNPAPGIRLPKAQMDHDSVALRVAVAELDETQQEPFREFISASDAQKVSLDIRRKLDANGLRVAILSSANSKRIQDLIKPIQVKPDWLSGQERELANAGKLPEISRLKTHRHVEKKRGESFHVETSPIQSSVSWCIYDGQQKTHDAATMAQGQMKITAWPQVDGTVLIEFVPEIHYGENLSRVGVHGKDLAVQQSREIKSLHALAFSVSMKIGETLVVAPAETYERAGKLLFCTDSHSSRSSPGEKPNYVDRQDEEFDEQLLEEHFPMLSQSGEEHDIQLAKPRFDAPQIEYAELDHGPPKPWRRFLMVRLVEVTPPLVSRDRLGISR